ncbi:pyridoxamine 5'-phosphate oxidase family protein [Luteipulveratus sp. YIM 133132]|uniref:pyridoxamine 5'-phosphate oxidase family protein n=1 Tax=Luteipulveratus flavus TaxID=3031728 RepID=UPI0023AFC904|nr:pyridoxamine 5'-phosphate oxidase family protein [Luteipulveratus sp. YIM 133132]MDE9365633.1 pyridoxamine 5'-phosphate oxidase family protein [Luteipulveratus sp. YIM 133132]
MDAAQVAEVLAQPLSRELMASEIPARLAYTGLDGAPRAIPIGFGLDGSTIVMWTVPTSAKVKALQVNPQVAITIDTQGFPPNVLLVRGTVELALVDGIPHGYVEAARKVVPADQMEGWEAGVRGLYEQMTVITMTPTWAKLIDFENTLPKAVADLVAERGDPR